MEWLQTTGFLPMEMQWKRSNKKLGNDKIFTNGNAMEKE
jgi:hypothetical protein